MTSTSDISSSTATYFTQQSTQKQTGSATSGSGSTSAGGTSSSATASSGGSSSSSGSDIKSQTTKINKDGSVTITITYTDGTTKSTTSVPDPTKAADSTDGSKKDKKKTSQVDQLV